METRQDGPEEIAGKGASNLRCACLQDLECRRRDDRAQHDHAAQPDNEGQHVEVPEREHQNIIEAGGSHFRVLCAQFVFKFGSVFGVRVHRSFEPARLEHELNLNTNREVSTRKRKPPDYNPVPEVLNWQ